MSQYGVENDNGLSMNVEQPLGAGGRHRLTMTYGRRLTSAQKAWYYALAPRDALAFDLRDVRNIYKSQGLYQDVLSQLRQYPGRTVDYLPGIFGRETILP